MNIEEIPKYWKKKQKDNPKKSNHKHIYEGVLIGSNNKEGTTRYHYGTVCNTCGKIGDERILDTVKEGRYNRLLHQEEVREKYKDLKLVYKNQYDKYIKEE